MKLYAIRDRLIEYYLNPFTGNEDKQVLASIAELINREEQHAIAQAPHQFEVWKLAEIDPDTGTILQDRELLATCDTLIRPRRQPTIREHGEAKGTEIGSRDKASPPISDGSAHKPSPADTAPTTPRTYAEVRG